MSFATESEKFSSERDILVVITPARESKSNFTLDSGTTYTYTFPYKYVSGISVDGVAYSSVGSSPSSGEYVFNSSTKLITINLGEAIANKTAIIVFYELFYSASTPLCYRTPTNSATDLIPFKPRILNNPSFSYNLSNYLNGIVDVGSSSINIANSDFDFNQYTTDNDSFYNKEIKLYYAINGISNIVLIYSGLINSIIVNREVSINFRNVLDKLNKSYLVNGTLEESRYTNYATDGSSVTCSPIKEEQYITVPKLYGFSTLGTILNSGALSGASGFDLIPIPNVEEMMRAICMNYNSSFAITNNREWGTVFSIGGDEGTITNGTITAVDQSNPSYDIFTVTHTSPSGYYMVGDYVNINGNYAQVLVASNGISTNTITTSNIAATINTSDPVTRYGIPVVCVKRKGDGRLLQISPQYYNINKVGNVRVIEFHDGTGGTTAPETFYSGSFDTNATISPDFEDVYYRAYIDNNQEYQHDDVIKEIIESADLTTNTSSFTTAGSALNEAFLMTAPFFSNFAKEDSIKNIITRCLTSVNGIIRVNTSNEIEYKLVSIGSPSYTLTDNDIINDSFDIEINYNDIITGIISNNEHFRFGLVNQDYSRISNQELDNNYLHNTSKYEDIEDVLADRNFASIPLSDYLNIRKNRMAIYSFSLGNRFHLNVGDTVRISNDYLLGTDTTKDVYIISITKSLDKIDIKAIDLLGL